MFPLVRRFWNRLFLRKQVENNDVNGESRENSGESSGNRRESRGYPLRWSLLIIAGLIALLNGGIIWLTYTALTQSVGGNNQFVIGALIGLLPTGITGLVGLGTTLLNERSN